MQMHNENVLLILMLNTKKDSKIKFLIHIAVQKHFSNYCRIDRQTKSIGACYTYDVMSIIQLIYEMQAKCFHIKRFNGHYNKYITLLIGKIFRRTLSYHHASFINRFL